MVNAFTDSPNYRRGALFVIYDEWGGFFDHVRPRACRTTGERRPDEDFGQIGFRVPAVAVSPYTRNGRHGAGRFGGWWFNRLARRPRRATRTSRSSASSATASGSAS